MNTLLQSPLNSRKPEKNVRADVLAAVLNASKNRANSEKKLLMAEIGKDADLHGVSKTLINTLATFNWISSALTKLLALPGRIVTSAWFGPNSIRFRSTDRSRYPTILDASRKVMELRSEERKL